MPSLLNGYNASVESDRHSRFDACGPRVTAAVVAKAIGVPLHELMQLSARVDRNGYTQFTRAKGHRQRVICAPRPWLRGAQERILRRVLSWIDASDCVYCRRGRDAIANARQHVGWSHTAALDLKDCFPSVTLAAVREAFRRLGYDDHATRILARMVTFHGRLPQGAPTSGAVLDLVMAPLDHELESLAHEYGAVYTRYVDDLSFSADRALDGLVRRAARLLAYHGFSLSATKSRVYGPDHRRVVTGIEVSSKLGPQPKYLQNLRDALRQTRSSRSASARSLQGKVDWVTRLDPDLARDLKPLLQRAIAREATRVQRFSGRPRERGGGVPRSAGRRGN